MASSKIVSQAQIARSLGLSRAAVSYALADSPKIAPETRKRVQELSQQLRYRPNVQAQSLRRSRSNVVGVACGPITDSYQAQLIDALERELSRRGFLMLMRSMSGSPEDAWERTLEFVDNRACGIIFQSTHPELHIKLTKAYPRMFSMVTLLGAPNPQSPSVSCDYDREAGLVANHLLAIGRKRWATNVTKGQYETGLRAKTRTFVQTAINAGLRPPVEVVLEGEYYESHLDEYGQIIVQEVMRKHPDTDAFFFSCDDIALAAISWLQRNGYRVPQDVAVVGFNDVPYAGTAAVPLTTVRQPVEQFARIAVEMLLEQMENGNRLSRVGKQIECELVIRQSTDAAYVVPPLKTPGECLRFLDARS